MREAITDIWAAHTAGGWICITTNGIVKSDGTAVMGAGVALEAAHRYPDLPRQLAGYLNRFGNRVFIFPDQKIITFPTKHHFRHPSDLELIRKSCGELMAVLDKYRIRKVLLPRPGCSNGQLKWEDVKAAIAPLLDDRVVACHFIGKSAPATATPPAENAQMDLFAPTSKVVATPAPDDTPAPSFGLDSYVNHSGGAYGADTEWDLIGRAYGVTDHRHYREQGNAGLSKRLRDAGVQAVLLTPEDLEPGYQALEEIYKKKFERNMANNLKARNFFQVNNAEAVFIIGFLKGFKAVKGGTDVAAQIGIRQGKPVYVFDLGLLTWHRWDGEEFVFSSIPVLTRNFAGVGTRSIENYQMKGKDGRWTTRPGYVGDEVAEAAREAIRDVYRMAAGN